jgi:hypothetical protein
MGPWLIVVQVLLPIPFAILLFLTLPFPGSIRSFILKICDSLIFFRIWGDVTVYQVLLGVSIILFAVSSADTLKGRSQEKLAENIAFNDRARCLRWRSERNFWITLLSLILWVILFRVRALIKENETYRRAAATSHRD